MKIAILSHSDYGGSAYFLHRGINRYTRHTSTHVRTRNCRIDYPSSKPTRKNIYELTKNADVVHVHDVFKGLSTKLIKPILITYHGSMYRKRSAMYNKRDAQNGWAQTVATLDLTLLGPKWLPDSRPEMHCYVNKSDEFLVCQAPTSRIVKSTNMVIRAMRGVNFDLIEKLPWKDALTRKGRAWVTIDQFKLGYGCNAIESWLMKQVVVANAEKPVLELIRSQLGFLPFVQCEGNEDSLIEAVDKLRSDKAFYNEMADRGYEYATKLHSQESAARRAIEYYIKTLDSFRKCVYAPIIKGRNQKRKARIVKGHKRPSLPESGKVLMQYLGKNVGKQTYTGSSSGIKYVVRSGDYILVKRKDVKALSALVDKKHADRGKKEKKLTRRLFVVVP